jgi:hypothetical protein
MGVVEYICTHVFVIVEFSQLIPTLTPEISSSWRPHLSRVPKGYLFWRWFVVIASMSKCEDAITVVLTTLIVALVAAIILLKTIVFH